MIDPYGGAIAIAKNETAFVHRDALYHFQVLRRKSSVFFFKMRFKILGYIQHESERAALDKWANELYWRLRETKIVSTFSYQNYPNLNMTAVFRESYYGENYPRLKKLKDKVFACKVYIYIFFYKNIKIDPENVFGSFAFSI